MMNMIMYCDVLSDWLRKLLEEYNCVDVHARASIGGGRGGTRLPTFQGGGQHRNCPPHFTVKKNCEAYSLIQHPSLSLNSRGIGLTRQ